MLQNEYLRLPVGAHIPEAFHEKLDSLARWVRGRHWIDIEADLILEAMLKYLDTCEKDVRPLYARLCLRMEAMSRMDDREYLVPSFGDFRDLIHSIPGALVVHCRVASRSRLSPHRAGYVPTKIAMQFLELCAANANPTAVVTN